MDLKQIENDVKQISLELLNAANLQAEDAIVIGGSTSEILGKDLGSATNIEVARVVVKTIVDILRENKIYPVIQACEHINRALVVEEEYAIKHNLDPVNVIPTLSAGGGFATAAMEIFSRPVVVEHVAVQAGIDIGDVFIGMHIKGVGVVVRSDIKEIGKAHISMIRTRPKLIGGARSKHYKT
ncbi:MAG TPA: TIGR01440 family protein [Tissierellaceae bacterium]|nr:TIGR01440 family protein [Tissierellaceae bacterium]